MGEFPFPRSEKALRALRSYVDHRRAMMRLKRLCCCDIRKTSNNSFSYIMNISEIEDRIKLLERIRDMFLEAGVCTREIDERFRRICDDIDDLYRHILESSR